MAAKKGLQGTILKLLRAGDYTLTVTGRHELSAHYHRISFAAGGLLTAHTVHPTMWVRLWFPDGDRAHQRGYTLVDPDPVADTFDVEFALHDGLAARWARTAAAGDQLDATVMGSSFTLREPAPAGWVITGDAASLPAVNSLLDAIGDAPARVYLEAANPGDEALPVRRDGVTWVARRDDGAALVESVKAAAFDASDHFGWVACDSRTTRAINAVYRSDYRLPRGSIKAQAYWMP